MTFVLRSDPLNHRFQFITFARATEADALYEAIPVWERAYAVTEIKRCVEGAAGTRDADKVIAEDALRRTSGLHPLLPLFIELPGCTHYFTTSTISPWLLNHISMPSPNTSALIRYPSGRFAMICAVGSRSSTASTLLPL